MNNNNIWCNYSYYIIVLYYNGMPKFKLLWCRISFLSEFCPSKLTFRRVLYIESVDRCYDNRRLSEQCYTKNLRRSYCSISLYSHAKQLWYKRGKILFFTIYLFSTAASLWALLVIQYHSKLIWPWWNVNYRLFLLSLLVLVRLVKKLKVSEQF